jgi:hypothetical protein
VQAQAADADGDGLPDAWEVQFGLDPASAAGDNGASGDPDRDFSTNLQEFSAGTHPRGFSTRYLAEGATGAFFDTTVAIANADPSATARVLLRFLTGTGAVISRVETIGPHSRRTVIPEQLAGLEAAEFSTVIESDVPVVVDRTMRWDAGGFGSHAETAIVSPGTTWYLAEGATHSNFDLFYLLQNPSTQPAAVTVTYLRPSPLPAVTRQYTVAPLSRFNIWVDQEGPDLANTDVSAIIQVTNGVSIIVERAMYLNAGGRVFGAGHESAGVRSPSATWFLAEGATGSYFDLFVLIANPYDVAADIEARYLLPSGTVLTKRYRVEPKSRFNIWVDLEDPALADTAVSTTLTSLNGVGVIAERAMWWPGPTSATWAEAHNAAGATAAGSRWVLAEGETGGTASSETYILIANTSSRSGDVLVRVLFEDGATAERTYTLSPSSRFNVPVGLDFPEAVGKRFGAVVEAVGAQPLDLVVERAVYDSPGGEVWTAGSDALGALTQSTTDSDGDGVTDVAEAIAGSNPQSPDSDGDGVSDGEEAARRTSPTTRETARVVIDPVNGERGVAVSREVIARFSQPLAQSTVLDASRFYATFAGQTLPARIDLSSDRRKATLFFAAPLPSASRVRVVLDGNALATVGGPAVDADGDGDPGGVAVADFETTSLSRIAGTDVWGYVYDAYTLAGNGGNRPIVGATIRVDGFPQANAVTDANGYFILRDMPAPEFFVHIDGTTATNAPAGFMYPSVGKPFHSVAGQSTQLTMDGTTFHVYLPPMAMGDVTTLSSTATTRVGFGPAGRAQLAALFPTIDPALWQQVAATVTANGAENDAGTPVTQAVIIPVPPQRLPAPLPPGARPQLVISVQALGATNFDRPAPVCFPNLPDAVTGQLAGPGTLQELMSFNHDAGRWDPVGTMRVDTEGRLVCTEPGVGVLAPGWHYPAPPPAGPCEAGPSDGCAPQPPPQEPDNCGGASTLDLSGNGPVFAAQGAACPVKPRPWWDFLGQTQDAVDQWLQNNVYTPYQNAMNQYNQQYSPTTGTGMLTGRAEPVAPVSEPLLTAAAPTFLDNCLSRAAFDGAIHRANGARAVLMALGASRSPSAIADVVIASMFASRTADDIEQIQALQCRDGATTGGTATRPDEDATAAQIILAGEQLASALYPLAVGRALAMPADVTVQVEALLAQAASLAGGDPIQWLRSHIVALEGQQAILERTIGEAPGYDTAQPLPYAAQILTTTGLVTDRGMTRAESNYALLVPPDQTVIQNTFYLAEWKLFAVAYPRLRPAGRTLFPRFHLANATMSDGDGDGLPDVAEGVYGTSSNDADSDDDGVKDGAEVAQGTDPLDTRPARTGVIRSIDTPGTAVDVCAVGDAGLVADRSAGVTLLGIDAGGIPTVTGRVDTPGDALAVACAGPYAVVADGSAGVAVLDVRVPADAFIRHQIGIGGAAQAVAVDQSVAYVGTTTGQLVSIDVVSGAILDMATLPGSVQDVSIAGDVLYAMTDGAVHTFPLGPSLGLANSVASPRPIAPGPARLRLFAGTDTLYATHSKGFNVFDLTTPLLPSLVVAGTNPEFGWRQIAPNGSGLGLAAVDGNQALDGPQDVALYNLQNRSVTTNRLLTMPTPGEAFAVAIANGYGLVADGSAGLQVVNYVAADTGTNPPTMSVTTNQPAGTAVEGRIFRVTAHVTDDVQVRAVEFWIDGALALVDTGFPFEYRRTTPLRSQQSSFTLRVRAVDTGGNVVDGGVTTIQVTADVTPPGVVGRTPRDGAQVQYGVSAVSVTFDEPVLPSSITTSNFRLFAAGTDGLAGTGDDVPVAVTSVALSGVDRVALLPTSAMLTPGLYRVVVGPGISDVIGNATNGTEDWTFRVVLGNLAGGEDFAITGSIAAPGAEQTWVFLGNAGQRVFIDGQNPCGFGFQDLRFTMTSPSGSTLFDSRDLSGCSLDAGTITLPASGVYRVRVFGMSGATGTYAMKIWDVPTPVAVPLTLNQTISNGAPAAGAGNIARPGQFDVFSLTLTAGQRLYADGANPCGFGFQDLRWRLTRDSDQAVIFPVSTSSNTGGFLSGCSLDVGQITIPTSGAYTLTVFGFDDDTGTYTATLWDATPPAPVALTLNQTISNGVPSAGRGNIEWPGQTDVFSLSLSAGQQIYADGANPCGFGFQDLRWRLTRDSDQAVIFPVSTSSNTQGDLSGCSLDVGPITIPTTGAYTLTVFGFDSAIGTYTATLWAVTAPTPVAINVGDTVSNGVPVAGAGNIETPGASDRYTFAGTANQVVNFDGLNPCGFGFPDLRWTVRGPGNEVVFDNLELSGCAVDPGNRTLPVTGTYTITVTGVNGAFAPYSFRIQ